MDDDIIHLLPEVVANQIAAGEVVQRPSSVIKELVENSIDAGATSIKIIIKAAGRTLIQVTDNGKGMSQRDAITAFERHATSKIQSADDLSRLMTMGFRGEALASIAAVAQVELRTRRDVDEIGTLVQINGGVVDELQGCACPVGATFAVKNLFYNVPARRKFLKSDKVEFSHIEECFIRIALVYPEIAFELYHNDEPRHILTVGTRKERISQIFGKHQAANLMTISAESTVVNVQGYVAKPESARRTNTHQYFFVNGRYMNSPFHKAVMQAYDRLTAEGTSPDYFLYLEVDPHTIDVNVHPTKTQIKFENDGEIFPIITAAVREVLGKFTISTEIDFEQDVNGKDAVHAPMPGTKIEAPSFAFDPNYNPFATDYNPFSQSTSSHNRESDWVKYRERFETDKGLGLVDEFMPSRQQTQPTFTQGEFEFTSTSGDQKITPSYVEEVLSKQSKLVQMMNKYIAASTSCGMIFIDQRRAHIRILYDKYLANIKGKTAASQLCLFRDTLELIPQQSEVLEEIMPSLHALGYDLQLISPDVYAINGVPPEQVEQNNVSFLLNIIDAACAGDIKEMDRVSERIAQSLARSSAIAYGQPLSDKEMREIVTNLFNSAEYAITPEGHHIFTLLSDNDIKRHLD